MLRHIRRDWGSLRRAADLCGLPRLTGIYLSLFDRESQPSATKASRWAARDIMENK